MRHDTTESAKVISDSHQFEQFSSISTNSCFILQLLFMAYLLQQTGRGNFPDNSMLVDIKWVSITSRGQDSTFGTRL